MKNADLMEKLLKRRKEITNRLERVRHDERHASGLSADFAEQAVERENDDVLHRLDLAISQEIKRIDRAIQNIEEDHFGFCESCSQAIEPARLEALPYATHCSRCRN